MGNSTYSGIDVMSEDNDREVDPSQLSEPVDKNLESKLSDYWKDFFTRYTVKLFDKKSKQQVKSYPYFEAIQQMRASPSTNENSPSGTGILYVDYADLMSMRDSTFAVGSGQAGGEGGEQQERISNYDALMHLIANDYASFKRTAADAVYNILREVQPEFAEQIKEKIYVGLINFSEYKDLSDLTSDDVEEFRRIDGQIVGFDNDKEINVIQTVWMCEMNHKIFNPGRQKPKKCYICQGLVLYEIKKEATKEDFIYIRLQQRMDRQKQGRADSKEIDVRYDGTELVQRIEQMLEPGQYVSVNGLVTLTEVTRQTKNTAGLEIQGSSLQIIPESDTVNDETDLDDLVRADIPQAEMHEHYEKLIRSFAPNLEGLNVEKEACTLQSAGTTSKQKEMDGSRFRGDLNILLIGDSAVGKSDLLKFQQKLRPRSMYAIGRQSSAIGLTAGIENIDILRNGVKINIKRVSFGVYPSCNGGIVCIDELDKRKKEDFEDISHPMDDYQSIHINKHGVHKQLSANCGSLHAANPSKNNGKYDRHATIFEQTSFAEWLLSRYDLIFIITDDSTPEQRKRLWEHVERSYSTAVHETDLESKHERINAREQKVKAHVFPDHFSQAYLRREIVYLREKYKPICEPDSVAWNMMKSFWNRYNNINLLPQLSIEEQLTKGALDHGLKIPAADKRKINTLLRIAEASARLHRRNIVTVEDMDIAIKLVKTSLGQLVPQHEGIRNKQQELQEKRAAMQFNKMLESTDARIRERNKRYEVSEFKRRSGIFFRYLRKMTWNRCDKCRERGTVKERESGEWVECPNCRGSKGNYTKFTYDNILRMCDENEIPRLDLDEFFKMCVRAKIIQDVGDQYYRVMFDLHRPDLLKQLDSEAFLNDNAQPFEEEVQDLDLELQRAAQIPEEPNPNSNPDTDAEVIPLSRGDAEAHSSVLKDLKNLDEDENTNRNT